ncbi:hypothetical protein BRETT_005163 [Brettanomyces bruxellensis]|uniref:Phenylalanine--tRNA ligase, mitochondrial n=1 Tax=Dekkera bruxellensis TaxID=5007 RepID=A0A871R8L6_DEKBR|nr:uncharacterized protein BRETT_005163 [Brettanomyces bruxellensis]QOU20505.1 hypothetical protein BRETT_005163 [Brettanomyces bruxellensis]
MIQHISRATLNSVKNGTRNVFSLFDIGTHPQCCGAGLHAAQSRRTSSHRQQPEELIIMGKKYKTDLQTNVTPGILSLVGRDLYKDPNHPVGILRKIVEDQFEEPEYTKFDDFEPVVSTYENFDVLGFPKDHPGRSVHDSYYINNNYLLRTHTSAHEHKCFERCDSPGYLIAGDVYRRDEIDRTHYPVFHQMEGARHWDRSCYRSEQDMLASMEAEVAQLSKTTQGDVVVKDVGHDPVKNPTQPFMTEQETDLVAKHLKRMLEKVVASIFNAAKAAAKAAGSKEEYLNEPLKVRWVEAYFPWTSPSWEIEVWWKGEWLECLGCGVVRELVFENSEKKNTIGWAFGLGLDRLAMLLFDIPDIRLFWTLDPRFKNQFHSGQISLFKPYSRYPGTKRDISFWLPRGKDGETLPLNANDLMEIVRENSGDLAESVKLIDEFVHPKTGRKSQCYRVNYQSMDRSLTNDEVNALHQKSLKELVERFRIQLR